MKPSIKLLEFFNKYKDNAGIKVHDQNVFLECIEDVEKLEEKYNYE
jgi:hypothetical protein